MYRKNVWEKFSDYTEIMDFNEGYKSFITKGKTERMCVVEAESLALQAGFKPIESFKTLKAGDKVYAINRGKNIAIFVVGKEKLEKGLNILGAHIDSPRLDIKQNPFYESTNFALMDTHYYGGIKKYQWVTIPLALHGVVNKKDGSVVEVHIGDDPTDPVLGISDLLVHLSGDQMQKTASKVIEGEALDLTLGSIPLKDAEKDKVKANILNIIKEEYGVEEEDFLSAEIEVVPAGDARDYGLDRSMVAGYGHDDRVCAYTSLKAVLDLDVVPNNTACAILVDKEEIGSVGATGAQSTWFINVIAELINLEGKYSDLTLRRTLTNSKMLSSDVSNGVDPLYSSVNEMKNSAFLGQGIVLNKYTGRAGKGGCNDANPEFIAYLRNIFDSNDICFQTAEIGKVDQGGGGTIAYILANYNMNVIDAGIPVLNMHAPMEIVSKADVYEAYLAYKAFVKA